ncbi:MAG: hypothetical protein WB538_20055 [Candidatus Sulfotelmatobacter sp.]
MRTFPQSKDPLHATITRGLARSVHDKPHSQFGTPPLVTFAAQPPCLSIPAQRTTLKIVKRLYTIGRIKGGMKFTCTHCAHHVSTLDFDLRDGNLRTQAATAINRHATAVHHEPVMFSSLDAQQHIYRA